MCEECSQRVHEMFSHTTVAVADRSTTSPQCSDHKENKNYYCEKCRVLICHTCTQGKHEGHSVKLLEREACECKKRLQIKASKLQARNKQAGEMRGVQMAITDAFIGDKTGLKTDNAKERIAVRDFCKRLHTLVTDFEKEKLHALKDKELSHRGAHESALSETGVCLTLSHAALERAEQVLRSDDVTLMTCFAEVSDLLDKALELPLHTVRVDEAPKFTIHEDKIDAALSSMCTLAAGDVSLVAVPCPLSDVEMEEESRRIQAAAAAEESRRKCTFKPHPNATLSADAKTATKTTAERWSCTLQGPIAFAPGAIHEVSIKIVKGTDSMVGVAPGTINPTGSNCNTKGWYLFTFDGTLFSGPPHNKCQEDYWGSGCFTAGTVINVRMDMTRGELSFGVNGVYKGVAFQNIPCDQPLYPTVEMFASKSCVQFV